MKKIILIPLFIFGCDTCDTVHNILTINDIASGNADEEDIQELLDSESGQWLGYDVGECVTIELHCADQEDGHYEYGEPDTDIMCICNW